MSGLLHDVGKIGVSDAIINKPAKLTDEEYAIIKSHPVMGARILQNIQERPDLAVGARWHHERYDGSGYPDGLAGNAIPDAARIIAVADAFDAMTSNRSYRKALPLATAIGEVERGRGTQFDPAAADAFLSIVHEYAAELGLQ
jgi:putative two-component system response regulator